VGEGHSDNGDDADKQCGAFWDGRDRTGAVQPGAGRSIGNAPCSKPPCCSGVDSEERAAESVREIGRRPQSGTGNSAQEPDVRGGRVGVPALGIIPDSHHTEKCTAGLSTDAALSTAWLGNSDDLISGSQFQYNIDAIFYKILRHWSVGQSGGIPSHRVICPPPLYRKHLTELVTSTTPTNDKYVTRTRCCHISKKFIFLMIRCDTIYWYRKWYIDILNISSHHYLVM